MFTELFASILIISFFFSTIKGLLSESFSSRSISNIEQLFFDDFWRKWERAGKGLDTLTVERLSYDGRPMRRLECGDGYDRPVSASTVALLTSWSRHNGSQSFVLT